MGRGRALHEAGLLALAAPEELGGEGLGLTEISVLLHEVGRRAAPLPVWETLACGLLPLVRSGSSELQADLVPQVLAGELMFAPALSEPGAALPATPAATHDGDIGQRHQGRGRCPRRRHLAAGLGVTGDDGAPRPSSSWTRQGQE